MPFFAECMFEQTWCSNKSIPKIFIASIKVVKNYVCNTPFEGKTICRVLKKAVNKTGQDYRYSSFFLPM